MHHPLLKNLSSTPRSGSPRATGDVCRRPHILHPHDSLKSCFSAISARSIRSALGQRSTFSYDERGNLLIASDPLSNTTTYAYNSAGRLKSVTDPLDHVTATSTDFAGRISSLTPPAGAAKTFAYDGAGNLIRIVQGEAITALSYDSRDRLTSVSDPEGNSTGYSYDATGCSIGCSASNDIPKSLTDPFGNVTENLFDKTGKVIGVQDPLGHLTSLGLDHNGRVSSRSDANGKTTTYAYDGLGRVTKQTDASGGITAFTYDPRGNLTSLSDPQGNITTFVYDKAGRKTKETRPLGQATSYTYTANGLLKTVKDAKNQITTYSYDAVGRLSDVTYADGQKDSFGYDAGGNLTSYANAQVSGTMTYDPAGRKSSESVTVGSVTKSFSYTYDPQGNKASYTSPEGITHSYQHDKAGKLTGISFDGKVVSLVYDKTRLKQMNYPNGVSSDYAYNPASWLTNITTSKAGTTLLSRGYSFDSVGNITAQASEHGATGYGYDDLYQLTSADHPDTISQTDEAYSYDKVGNRTSSVETSGSWSYNKNNELQNSITASYEYDANGNTIKKSVMGTGSAQAVPVPLTTLYHYDARNRLSQVTLPDGSIATYAYDPFGRRVKKTLATQTTLYTYADEGLIGEYAADGSVQTVYGWKPDGLWGTDPLYLKQNGILAFYHNDHLGTPQKLTDGQGGVVWSATYAAFGLATVDAESTVTNNLRLPGQYFDAETGGHWNFQRYYEPETGRYTQVDPIGFVGGDANLFVYSRNNSLFFVDPIGTSFRTNCESFTECMNRCVSQVDWNIFGDNFIADAFLGNDLMDVQNLVVFVTSHESKKAALQAASIGMDKTGTAAFEVLVSPVETNYKLSVEGYKAALKSLKSSGGDLKPVSRSLNALKGYNFKSVEYIFGKSFSKIGLKIVAQFNLPKLAWDGGTWFGCYLNCEYF